MGPERPEREPEPEPEYASASMQELLTRRETSLGLQPPALGEDELEAVAETLRSGWLTSEAPTWTG